MGIPTREKSVTFVLFYEQSNFSSHRIARTHTSLALHKHFEIFAKNALITLLIINDKEFAALFEGIPLNA